MGITKFHEDFALEVEAIKAPPSSGRFPIVLEQEDRERGGTPVMAGCDIDFSLEQKMRAILT